MAGRVRFPSPGGTGTGSGSDGRHARTYAAGTAWGRSICACGRAGGGAAGASNKKRRRLYSFFFRGKASPLLDGVIIPQSMDHGCIMYGTRRGLVSSLPGPCCLCLPRTWGTRIHLEHVRAVCHPLFSLEFSVKLWRMIGKFPGRVAASFQRGGGSVMTWTALRVTATSYELRRTAYVPFHRVLAELSSPEIYELVVFEHLIR